MRHITSLPLFRYVCLACIATFSLCAGLHAQIRYELIVPEVMGNPVNQTSTRGNEINESGETLLNRITTFAVWKKGAITHIANSASDYPASLSQVRASSINSYQQVVGSKTYRVKGENGTRSDTFPFYWDPSNGLVDLDDLGSRSEHGTGNTTLYGINDEGVSIGVTDEFSGDTRVGQTAFLWSFENGRIDIPALSTLDSQSHTLPNAINEDGITVGTYRSFLGSPDAYTEAGFVYSQDAGSLALKSINSDFFTATHTTARDVNNSSTVTGEQDENAYVYNLETNQGQIISPLETHRTIRAFAINDLNIVAGAAESIDQSGANAELSPILWSKETGVIELQSQIETCLKAVLPANIDTRATRISPKSINSMGQISATLEAGSAFKREVILQPTLEFDWTSMTQKSENGIRGVLYRHIKSDSISHIPTSVLGYEIGFECSPDMENWDDIAHPGSSIRHLETEEMIELFVPFSDCIFVRPTLVEAAN